MLVNLRSRDRLRSNASGLSRVWAGMRGVEILVKGLRARATWAVRRTLVGRLDVTQDPPQYVVQDYFNVRRGCSVGRVSARLLWNGLEKGATRGTSWFSD